MHLWQRLKNREIPDLEWTREQLDREGYYSQFGQDKFVAERLSHKRNGVFFDIGAADGLDINNTYYFEKELGWSGVAVEPHPELFQKLARNRRCALVNGGVSDFNGKAKFLSLREGFGMLSKIVQKPITPEDERRGLDMSWNGEPEGHVLIPCFTLNEIARRYHLRTIDFLSIDTEGEELSIVRKIDFSHIEIRLITVERSDDHDEVKRILQSHGFRLVATTGCDAIFECPAKRWAFFKSRA
jgi:FkbM family methyltransferase